MTARIRSLREKLLSVKGGSELMWNEAVVARTEPIKEFSRYSVWAILTVVVVLDHRRRRSELLLSRFALDDIINYCSWTICRTFFNK
ncbi:hypothetical protein QYF36_016025 [Acer negundo]|nr:hypothetical protein QYF36_016025 [Acer negundo]